MSVADEMLRSSPSAPGYSATELVECIEACTSCAQACVACADACLGEEMVADLRRCISTDLTCADICETTGRVLSRQTDYETAVTQALLEACRRSCQVCAAECEHHAGMHEHCRICAEACRRCEAACAALLAA